jgi:hypothetical protein
MQKLSLDIKSANTNANKNLIENENENESGESSPKKAKVDRFKEISDLNQKRADLALHMLNRKDHISHTWQWLPADFGVSKSGKVSVLSYINNLDPSIYLPSLFPSPLALIVIQDSMDHYTTFSRKFSKLSYLCSSVC